MPIATMTSKGQTTIPKEIRDHLNLKPGDQISYTVEDGGRVVLRAKNLHPSVLQEILPGPHKALSLDDIDDAIARAVLEKDARSRY